MKEAFGEEVVKNVKMDSSIVSRNSKGGIKVCHRLRANFKGADDKDRLSKNTWLDDDFSERPLTPLARSDCSEVTELQL